MQVLALETVTAYQAFSATRRTVSGRSIRYRVMWPALTHCFHGLLTRTTMVSPIGRTRRSIRPQVVQVFSGRARLAGVGGWTTTAVTTLLMLASSGPPPTSSTSSSALHHPASPPQAT